MYENLNQPTAPSAPNASNFGADRHCRSFRQSYLSALLLLGFSSSMTPASAHEGAFIGAPAPVVPTHSFVHTTSPTHSSASLNASTSKLWTNKSTQAGQSVTLTGSNALNLASGNQSFTATQIGSFSTITLDLGGKQVAFNLGGSDASKMTAAELVAAAEITSGGRQTLTLNSLGEAVGGSIVLNQKSLSSLDTFVGGSLSSLLIPKSVELIDKVSDISLSGNLVNYGKIVVGSNAASGGDIISAADTYNSSGASISSVRGSDLTLLDGQSLTNTGSITAGNNLFINGATVNNGGSLAAQNGNVNFTTLSALNLNNGGGTIRATGNVNVRDASYAGNNGISIGGGSILSKELNIFTGSGEVDTTGVNITGVVNTDAAVAHVVADSKNLRIGNTDVTGDPLFANQGNIIINGNVIGPQNGANLSFVASGNIVSAGGSIDTSSTTGSGGQINLIAGANFVSSGAGKITLENTPQAVGGGSVTGGLIDLTGKNGGSAPITAITSATSASGAVAGDITMVAFAGANKGSGTITVPSTVTINASGTTGVSYGGNVTLIAGALSGTAISVGNINVSGGQDNDSTVASLYAGTITLNTGIASVSGISITQNGGLSAAIQAAATNTNANITTGNLLASSGTVNVNTLGNFSFGNIDVSGYGGNAASQSGSVGGTVYITAANTSGANIFAYGGGGAGGGSGTDGYIGGNGGGVTIAGPTATTGSLSLSGSINAAGGGGGGGGGQSSNGKSGVGAGGSGGSGGDITVNVGNNIIVGNGILDADGGSGGSGSYAAGPAGSGGGGGGSLGAGGGGGASGLISAAGNTAGTGGGGGGGLYGGGGGGAVLSNLTVGSVVSGSGAGFGAGGAGGISDANGGAGGSLNGGNGANNGGIGGAQYLGGSAVGVAAAGQSAFANGVLADLGNTANVVLDSTLGNIGSSKAPLELLSYEGYITGTNGYLDLPATISMVSYLSGISVSTGADSSATISNYTNAANPTSNVNILGAAVGQNSSLAFYNYGNSITVTAPISGANDADISLNSFLSTAANVGSITVNANVTTLGDSGSINMYATGVLNAKANFSAPGGVELSSNTASISLTGNTTANGSAGSIIINAATFATINGNLTGNTSPNGAVEVQAKSGSLTINGNVTGTGTDGFIYLYSDGSLTTNGTFQTTGGGSNSCIELSATGGINAKGTYTATNSYIYVDGANEGTINFDGKATAGGTDSALGYGIYIYNYYFPVNVSGSLTTTGTNGGINIQSYYNDLVSTATITTSGSNSPITISNYYGNETVSGALKTTGANSYIELDNSSGAVNFSGSITASGTASYVELYTTEGLISSTGNITTSGAHGYIYAYNEYGSINLKGNLTATGSGAYIDLKDEYYGNLTVNGNLTVSGQGSYISEIADYGSLTQIGSLTQTGNNPAVSGNYGIEVYNSSGPLTVTGAVSTNGNISNVYIYTDSTTPLNVTGNVTASGPSSFVSIVNDDGSTTINGNISATGSGGYIYTYADGPLTINGNSTASGYIEHYNDYGPMVINGNLSATSSSGYVELYSYYGLSSINVNGSITANGSDGFSVGSYGPFDMGKGSITAQTVDLTVYGAGTSKTPLLVNSPSVLIGAANAENVYVNDTSTAKTSLSISGALNIINFASASTALTVTTPLNVSGSFNAGIITDNNKSGGLAISPLGTGSITAYNSLTLNSVGNISSTTGNFEAEGSLTLTSTSGNIGTSSANFLVSSTETLTATTGKTGSAFLLVNGSPTLQSINAAGGVDITTTAGNHLTVNGLVTAATGTVSLSSGSIFAGTGTAALSGQNIVLTSTDVGTGTIGTVDQYLNISTVSPTGTLSLYTANNAYLNVTSGVVNFVAGGTSTAPGVLSLSNSTGSLTLGTGTLSAAPSTILLSAKTNLTLNSSLEADTPATFEMVAGGLLTLPGDTLTVAAAGGGKLFVDANTLAFTGTKLSVSANATGANGNGGNIIFDLSGKTNYTIGSAGQLAFSALPNGTGNGGDIHISTGGTLSVNQNGLLNQPIAGKGGAGGNLAIASTGNMTVTTGLSTAGDGTGTGGNLTLSTGGTLTVAGNLSGDVSTNLTFGNVSVMANGKTAFTIGGTTPANGITGTITGGDIQVANASGITLSNTLAAGGTTEFDTTLFNNTAGTITGDKSLILNSGTGNLSIVGAATGWGAPTTVTLTSGGSLNAGPLFTTGSAALTSAYNITINAKGALTLDTNNITADSASATPGNLTISAASITTKTSSSPRVLSAFGTNYDGNVSLTETGTGALTLGTGAGQVEISVKASGAPGVNNGGSVYVSNSGNLTYTAGGIVTDSPTVPGLNTNLTLLSSKALQLVGFNQNIVNTANLIFGSNSATPFTISTSTTVPANGIQLVAGTLTANNLTISNAGGGIGAGGGAPIIVDTAGLTLNAKGAVYATDNASAVMLGASSGSSFSLSVSNGTLGQTSGPISTKALQLTANNFTNPITTNATSITGAANASGGTWSVIDTTTGAVTLNDVTAGTGSPTNGSLVFQTAGALVTSGAITGSSVNLIAGNGIIVNGTVGEASGSTSLNAGIGNSAITEGKSSSIDGVSLSLQAGSGGLGGKSALIIDAANLALTTPGIVNLTDNSKADTTVSTVPQPVQSFTLNSQSTGTVYLNYVETSNGAILVNASAASGGITLSNSLYAGNGSLTLNAASAGPILVNTGSLTASNGNISISGTQFATNALTASGNITLSSTGTGSDTVTGTVVAGGNFTTTSTGMGDQVTLNGNMQAQNISISASKGTVTALSGTFQANAAKGAVSLSSGGALAIGSGAQSAVIDANSGGVILSGAGVELYGGSTINTYYGGSITASNTGANAILINGALNASGAVSLTNAGGTSSQISVGGSVTGSSVLISSGTGAGTAINAGGDITSLNGGITLNAGAASVNILAGGSLTANNGNIAITLGGTAGSTIAGPVLANNTGNITITNAGSAALAMTNNITTDQGSITLNIPITDAGGSFTTNGATITTGTGAITINLAGAANSLTTTGGSFTTDFAPGSTPAKLSGGFTINLSGAGATLGASGTSFAANFGNFAVNMTGNTTELTLDTGSGISANTGNIVIASSGNNNVITLGNTNGAGNLTANGGSITISSTGSFGIIQTLNRAGSSFTTDGGNIDISATGASSSINLFNGTGGSGITASDGSVTVLAGASSTGLSVDSNIFAGSGDILISNAGTGTTNVAGDLHTLQGNLNIIDSNSAGAISYGYASMDGITANINNGNVTIQNTNNSNGVITFAANSSVHASATAANLGNVTVADGTFTQAMLKAQTTPPNGNVTYDIQPGGAIYFASSSPAGQPNFAATGTVLNADGRAITLFVGGSTGQINIDGGVTLTADPPPAAALTPVVQSSNFLLTTNGASTLSHALTSYQSDAIQAGSISPVTAITSPASGTASTSVTNLPINSANALPSSQTRLDGQQVLNGSGNQAAKVLYGGVTGHSKKALVSGNATLEVKQLENGARLLSADHDILLQTALGTVFAAKGALVLIVSDDASLSVYNLDDTRHEAVTIMVGQEKITLTPGRHVTVTNRSGGTFEAVNPIKTLGYRAVSSHKLNDILTVHNSEFSLPSAMATVAPIKMLISSEDQNQKKVGAHLLKTAAILQTISTASSHFELMVPAQATAMR